MKNKSLNVLQINTADISGGAEKISWLLFQSLKKLNFGSQLIVGIKNSNEASIIKIPNFHDQNNKKFTTKLINRNNFFNSVFTRYFFRTVSLDWKAFLRWVGIEDYYFPKSRKILDFLKWKPDIIHAHNLHGGYFDLRYLKSLSKKVPVLITLHDEWLLTGHCAYTLQCPRWKTGCGSCPDLTRYPGIKHDLTALNFKRKKGIFDHSKLFIVTPSKWLMDKVNLSILSGIKKKIIPYGIDQNIFFPTEKNKIRNEIGIPMNDFVILFVANHANNNVYKDQKTVIHSISKIKNELNKNISFISLGGINYSRKNGKITKIEIPYQSDQKQIAKYYQAADVFLHAAKADNYPLTILESLCCGIPVIATSVGGISEQIKDGITGFLIPQEDPISMASKIDYLLDNPDLLKKFSIQAANDSKVRFNLDRMIADYLDFYEEVIETWKQMGN